MFQGRAQDDQLELPFRSGFLIQGLSAQSTNEFVAKAFSKKSCNVMAKIESMLMLIYKT